MRRRLKAIGAWLYRFPALPETVILILLATLPALIWCDRLPYPIRWQAGKILAVGGWISAAGILLAVVCGICRIRDREKERGGALLLFAFGAVLWTAGCIVAYYLYFYLGPANDHFADRLHLPDGVALREPGAPEAPYDFRLAKTTSFQSKVLDFLPAILPIGENAFYLPSLEKLQEDDPESNRLLEYLAIHPEWRLYRESVGGHYLATRRFFGATGALVTPRDGSYRFSGGNVFYRYRLDLRLTGRSWNNRRLESGNEQDIDAVYHRYSTRSKVGKCCVEVLDESTVPGRLMTRRTMFLLEEEFSALAAGRQAFPAGTIQKGDATLNLIGHHGDYTATIRCNPGEAGDIYLKAYEITGNTPLSADHLRRTATERIGYSADPQELFFGQIPFRIYEGDWGQFYGVRIEVWFAPQDRNSPDRKLLEGNFKLEGWMREM